MPQRDHDEPAPDRKPVARTTIVGGQPDVEPNLRTVPVGMETLLAMAAVDEAFARELLEDPDRARRASGVMLTPTEEQILLSVDRDALAHMISRVGDRIPDRSRRAFLKKSAAALLAIVGGAALSGCRDGGGGSGNHVAVTGAVADFPPPPKDSPRRWTKINAGAPGGASTVFDDFPVLSEGSTYPVAIYFHAGTGTGLPDDPDGAEFEEAFLASRELSRASRGFRRYRCPASALPAAVIERRRIEAPCILFCHASGTEALRIDLKTKDLSAAAAKLQSILRDADAASGDDR